MLSKKNKKKQTNKREKKLIIYKICLAKYPREKSSPEKRPRENCPPENYPSEICLEESNLFQRCI